MVRFLVLLALLGIGTGVFFKATTSEAATNDFVVLISDNANDPVPAGTTFPYTVTVTDGGSAAVLADANLTVYLTFSTSGVGRAVLGVDYEIDEAAINAANAGDWVCTIDDESENLLGCVSVAQWSNADAPNIPVIDVPVDVLPGATNGRVIRLISRVDSPATGTATDSNQASENVTILSESDLEVVKDDVAGTVIAGASISFPITVTNLGPSTSGPISITDNVPTNLTLAVGPGAFNPGGGWSCNAAGVITGSVITCTHAALAVNASASFSLPFTVNATAPAGTITNTAFLTSDDGDDEDDNDSDDGVVNVGGSTNLGVTKTVNSPTVSAGGSVIYSLGYTASGATFPTTATITDSLTAPAGFSYTVASVAPWTCLPAAGVASGSPDNITCTANIVAPGSGPVATITVTVPPTATTGTVSNSAVIIGPNTDPVPANNNIGPITATISAVADIALTKCAIDSPAIGVDCALAPVGFSQAANDPFIYRVLVTNNGPSAAPANTISVGDSLPTNVVFTGAATINGGTPASAGWTCTGGTLNVSGASITCTNTTDVVDALTSVYIDLPVSILPVAAAGSQVCNQASANITAPLVDPNTANNTNTPGACVLVVTVSDIGISKVAQQTQIFPGGLINYAISVTNAGPSAAVSPFFDDDLSLTGLKVVSLSTVGAPGWTCVKNPGGQAVNVGYTGAFRCTGPANFAVGANAVVLLTVQAGIDLGGEDNAVNTVVANLPGPNNTEFLCPNAAPGDPEDSPADATCNGLPDSSTATVEILEYDLGVTKEATVIDEPQAPYLPGSAFAGGTINYAVTVGNLGPDDAPVGSVSLGDGRDQELDLQGTLDTSLAPQFVPSCTVGPDNPPQFNKSFTCNNQGGEFVAGGPDATVSYNAVVDPATPAGTLVCNSATITVNPSGADTNDDNDEYEICTTVVTASDLQIIKTGPPSAQANSTLQYGITITNLSTSPALSPRFYDAVPVGTTFQSISAPLGWACLRDSNNGPLTTGLPAGTMIRCDGPQNFTGTSVFTLIVRLVAAPPASIENNQPVTANAVLFGNGACVVPGVDNFQGLGFEINDDPNLENNCDTESTPVETLTEITVLKTALNPLNAGQGQPTNAAPYDAPSLYRVEVKNTGPGIATALTFEDVLPAGVTVFGTAPVLEYISGSTSLVTNQASLSLTCATYNGVSPTATCLLGDLAPGASLKFNIRVALDASLAAFPEEDCNGAPTPEAGVQVCNRATFTSASFDLSMFNQYGVLAPITEFDDDKQTVGTSSDLSIVKTNNLVNNQTCSGSNCQFTYTIAVDNLGPSDTPTPIQFTDFFPANLTITDVNTAGAPGWFCETLPANPGPNGNNLVDVPLNTPVSVVCSSNPNVFTAAGGQAIFEIDVTVLDTALAGSSFTNNVCLWTNGTPPAPISDPVISNNCSANVVQVLNGNTITGTKRLDLDGDGNPADADTTPLAGFEIFVDSGVGTGGVAGDGIKNGTEPSAVTNALGVYTISGLIGGGPFTVCETPKTGYTQTGVDIDTLTWLPTPLPVEITPGSVTEIDLPSGQTCAVVTFQVSSAPSKTVTGVDFLNFQNFAITGFKFEDVNGNGTGVQELNESGVDDPPFTLFVDYNDNGLLDLGEPSSQQITGFPTGDYKISNVGPCLLTGNICQVREIRTAGWIQTFPHGVANLPITDANGVPLYPYDPDQGNVLNQANSAANSVPVPGTAGATVPNVMFSNFKLVAISGLKFNDLDADGQPREAGEPTLAGFKICWDFDSLNGCTATDPEVPTTAVDGTYTILVGPGTTFDICENLATSPSGWTATYPVDDSAANCHLGLTADSGDTIANINFGNFQNIIQGYKWNDVALTPALPDGIWTPNGVDTLPGTSDDELGLAGWLICAIPVSDPGQTPDCNPSRMYKATTDANGFYQIKDLPGGTTYRICEEPKVGWVQTYPSLQNCHTLTISSASGPNIADHIYGSATSGLTQPYNFGNNSPLPPVDMSVTKSAPSSVVVGGNLDFTFTVVNNSAAPAKNVKLTDTVNPLLTTTFVGTISPTPGSWSCAFAAGVLTCSRTGDMPANSSETVKVRFTAVNTPSNGTAYPNTVCVSADNPDPSTANNCSTTAPGTVVTAVPVPAPGADLVVDKAASPLTAPQQLGPNQIIEYRIRVRNFGPSAASFVKVTDVLTSGLKFNQMMNQGTYTCTTPTVGTTGTVTCKKASVANGASNTIWFKVQTPNPVPADGSGLNQAKVEQCTDNTYTTCSTSLNDPNSANNIRTAQASLP